jgi:hypothetical protein
MMELGLSSNGNGCLSNETRRLSMIWLLLLSAAAGIILSVLVTERFKIPS